MELLNFLKRNLILLIIIIILLAVICCGVLFFNYKTEQILVNSRQITEYNEQMGELFVALQEHLFSQNTLNHKKDVFMVYSMGIIVNYYTQTSSAYDQMSKEDIIIFLEEIYMNSIVYGIDPFLPLAFARVETGFYYTAVGLDGERSVFQFMDETARETYAGLNSPYLPEWWKDPKEAVRLWFSYYHKLSNHFINENEEKQVRWSALAYNVGLYRNQLRLNFNSGADIDMFVSTIYKFKGNPDYNKNVWLFYNEYKQKFNLER